MIPSSRIKQTSSKVATSLLQESILKTKYLKLGQFRSFIEHLFIFLEIHLEFLVLPVLGINRSNISDIPDSAVIVLLEIPLVGFNLLP